MKHAFLSKLQQLTPKIKAVLSRIKPLLLKVKNFLSRIVQMIPQGFRKWVFLALIMILVIGLACCFNLDGSTAEPIQRVVATNNLAVYKKADSDSRILSLLPVDLEVQILEQKTAAGTDWGRIDPMELPDGTKTKSGWINLQYVKSPEEMKEPEPTEPVPETEPQPVYVPATMGTVTAGKLNIRKGAGSQYDPIDSYLKGDRVEIIETVIVDDTVWGRTGIGWIGMGYVRMDGTPAPVDPEADDSDAIEIVSDGSLGILGYGVVDLGTLNVRSGPGTEYERVRTVSEGTRYAYYEETDDWVRIEDGWVSKEYFYMEGTTADDAGFGTVTIDKLNIRTGPHTTFQSIGTCNTGDAVDILAQVGTWGYTGEGWISMTYVELAPPTYTTGTGIAISGLNIREEPNADSKIVDAYKKGDSVLITEVSGEWGKTDKGWINLAYVDFD